MKQLNENKQNDLDKYQFLAEELQSISNTTSRNLVGTQIADILRKYIILGKLEDGEHIVEEYIALSANASRIPVREALRTLEAEGLIINLPRKGAQVVGISNDDIIDIFRIRTKIEELACEYIIKNADEAIIEEGKKILDEIAISIEIADRIPSSWSGQYNDLFNQWIGKACGSKRIEMLHKQYNGYITTFRNINSSSPSRRKKALAEHLEIWKAITARDIDMVIKSLNEHMNNALNSLIQNRKEKSI